jgi:putative intracellular protease/amidase
MGFEEQLYGANTKKAQVVRDGNIITACGAGAAFEFAFELLTAITGSENESRKNKKAIMIKE